MAKRNTSKHVPPKAIAWSVGLSRIDKPDEQERARLIALLGSELRLDTAAIHREITEIAARYRLDRNMAEDRPIGAEMAAHLERISRLALELAECMEAPEWGDATPREIIFLMNDVQRWPFIADFVDLLEALSLRTMVRAKDMRRARRPGRPAKPSMNGLIRDLLLLWQRATAAPLKLTFFAGEATSPAGRFLVETACAIDRHLSRETIAKRAQIVRKAMRIK